MNVSVEEGSGKEYHVSIKGDDSQGGSASTPLKTISAVVALAMHGDMITVHEGIYRERILGKYWSPYD